MVSLLIGNKNLKKLTVLKKHVCFRNTLLVLTQRILNYIIHNAGYIYTANNFPKLSSLQHHNLIAYPVEKCCETQHIVCSISIKDA